MSPLAVVKHLDVTHATSFGLIAAYELNIILRLLLHEEMGGGQGHSVALTESKRQTNPWFRESKVYKRYLDLGFHPSQEPTSPFST